MVRNIRDSRAQMHQHKAAIEPDTTMIMDKRLIQSASALLFAMTLLSAPGPGFARPPEGVQENLGAARRFLVSTTAQAVTVDELIRHIDRLWRGDTSHATMTMAVKTLRYERVMTMESWSRAKDYSLVVIREPVKDRDVATLKVRENIWNYLPKINRVTKVPSSMMAGSWMGSHFTNDDLVKESTFEDEYDSSITFDGMRDGKLVWELTSVARPDAAVVWGKVVNLIDQQTMAPTSARYYDESGTLIRTLVFDRLKRVGERMVPMRMRLQPHDKPGESTEIVYQDIAFGLALEESFFSLQSLQRRR